MKRRFTILSAAFALLVSLAIPMGMWGQTRTEVVTYTLNGTEIVGNTSAPYNAYASYSPVEQNEINWQVMANTTMSPWRIGGKNLTNVERPVYSTNPIPGNITKIVVEHGAASSITVNSWTVIVASDADFANIVSTLTPSFTASSSTTINRPAGADWTGCYYKFVYNVSVTGSTNRFVQFVKAEFYKEEGGNPTCETPTFSPAAGTYTQAQSVSINCTTEEATIYYTTNGQDPTTSSTVYSGAINVSSNTTIKAMAAKTGYDNSAVASATYNFVTPMTIAEVRAQETGDVVTTGTVTSCVGTTGYIQDATAAICVYGTSLTVGDNISVLGTLSTYNGLLEIINPQVTVISSGNTVNPETMTVAQAVASTNQGWYIRIEDATVTAISDKNVTIAQGDANVVVRFANTSDITFEVNDIISLNGNIGAFNGVQIANPQNVTVQENTDPAISAEDVSIASDATGGNIVFTIDNPVSGGVTSATTNDEWLTLGTVGSATVPFTCTANTATTARTATVVLTYTYNRATVTKEVTVTQAAYEAPHVTWDLSIASYDEVTDPDLVTWSSNYATMTNATGTGSTSASNYLGGDANNRTSTRFYKNNVWTLSPAAGYAITSVVLIATSQNYANAFAGSDWTNATASVDGTTVTIAPTDGTTDIVATISGTCGFTSVTVYYQNVYRLTIYAFDESGYCLISSPIGNVNPENVTNMLTQKDGDNNTYDLYRFDQAQALEWRNYRSNDGGGFDLVAGQGYLYGNINEVELVFTGNAYNGDGKVTLSKADVGEGLDFPGWNLVGNPFATEIVEIKDDNSNTLNFYTMHANGRQIVATTNTTIQPMEGVFVIADEDGEEITFTPVTEGSKGSLAALNLSNGNEFVDRAIVRFGQGRQLPKLQLDRNSSKLYIPQDGQDYAVVYSEEMGALPVNFKAENNGTYNLSLSSENVEFAYLHLIDNMTGNDVDLLQTPSYSFEAKTTDFESRFKLVFATGDNSNDDNFAFYSNGSFVINNPSTGSGPAELQVIDITGRIVKSESINGCTNVNVNAAPGVYMLRLINGDNVKTQKVVVK